ncbi:MAG: GtrA family protein [Clostridiales bacterium]|jgi:putative flippase GtrA|nr:GtrA family protein [Clostridiales bacterium]
MKTLWQRLRKSIRGAWESERIRELFRYCVIGVLTTAVSFGTLWVFENLCGWNANLANALSIICAVLFAYVTNKLFVFRTHCTSAADLVREAVSFFAARGFAMLVEWGGFYILHDFLRLPSMWAKAAISVIVLVLNYVLSKLVVFRKNRN